MISIHLEKFSARTPSRALGLFANGPTPVLLAGGPKSLTHESQSARMKRRKLALSLACSVSASLEIERHCVVFTFARNTATYQCYTNAVAHP